MYNDQSMFLEVKGKSVGWVFILLNIVSFGLLVTGILLNIYVLCIVPLVCLLCVLAVLNYKWGYYLLLASLPLSVSTDIGTVSLDLPSELIMLALMCICIGHLLYSRNTLNLSFFRHPILFLFFIHWIWIILCSFHAQIPIYSFKYWLAKTWYIFSFIIGTGLFIQTALDFKKIFWSIYIPLTVIIVYVLIRHAGLNFSFSDFDTPMRPFFHTHVHYASMITLFMPYLWVAARWYRSGTVVRLLLQFSKGLYLIAIYFSFTRAAILALIIAGIAFFLFKARLLKWSICFCFLLIGGGVLFLAYQNNYLQYAVEFEKVQSHQNYEDHLSATIEGKDISSMERINMWIGGIRMIKNHFFMGYGPSNFYDHYKPYTIINFHTWVSENKQKLSVHNYYLLTWIEQGFIGLLIFLAICITAVMSAQRAYFRTQNKNKKRLLMAVFLSTIIILCIMFLNDVVESDEIGSLFFVNLSLIAILDTSSRK